MGPEASRLAAQKPPENNTPEAHQFMRVYIGVWIAFLLLLLVLILLAAVDIWSTRLFSVREQRKILDDKRAMLERRSVQDAERPQWACLTILKPIGRLKYSPAPTQYTCHATFPFFLFDAVAQTRHNAMMVEKPRRGGRPDHRLARTIHGRGE